MNMDMSLIFRFFNYCNSQLSNENDYSIAVTILNKLIKDKNLSIESVAEDTVISQASVSRFIRKCGFSSWADFRENMNSRLPLLKQEKTFLSEQRFAQDSDSEICEKIYADIQHNIQSTHEKFGVDKLMEIVNVLRNAKSVSFYGDDHALSIFYILQLDLLMSGIPAYLFKNEKIQEFHSTFQGEGDVVIYLTVYKKFLDDQRPRIEQIRKMHENGAKTILFAQDDLGSLEDMFDVVYKYGDENGINNGYYSLFYICQMLSALYTSKDTFRI